MEVSHPAVHPVAVPPALTEPPARVRMKDYQGMPGTLGGVALRLGQLGFAVLSFSIMVSTPDFDQVTAFWWLAPSMSRASCWFQLSSLASMSYIHYLVAATVLQTLWSFIMAIVDIYALSVRRSLHHSLLVGLFAMGDGVTSTLTFAAACATAGITVLIDNDLDQCRQNHCGKYEAAAAMAFLSWIMAAPSFLLTFWLLATR